MSNFILTIDLTEHEYPGNPMAQRQFVVQMLQQAGQQIGSGYVDDRVKTGRDLVAPDHESVRHKQGEVHCLGEKVCHWRFIDSDPEQKP